MTHYIACFGILVSGWSAAASLDNRKLGAHLLSVVAMILCVVLFTLTF